VAGGPGPAASVAGGPVPGVSSAAPPWTVIQHVDHEGPGLIGEALRHAGIPFGVVRPDRGEQLPDPGSTGGLVVMGGPMGVHDVDDHPWLDAERTLVSAIAGVGRPVLGICLGAQQLALALGGTVTRGAAAEVGIGRVELTGSGRLDPVLGPEYGGLATTTIPCVHWHQDTFSIPDGAVHLAATQAFPHQAFRWGDRAYGLQFHVEVSHDLAAVWRPHLPEGVELDGARLTEVETVGRRLLRRFVDRSVAPSPTPSASGSEPFGGPVSAAEWSR
jgi:GMP synthase (glutamine-hydrolysing)